MRQTNKKIEGEWIRRAASLSRLKSRSFPAFRISFYDRLPPGAIGL